MMPPENANASLAGEADAESADMGGLHSERSTAKSSMCEAPDYTEARRYLTLLDEVAEHFEFRVLDDDTERSEASILAHPRGIDPRARGYSGPFDGLSGILAKANADRCGVFVVANAGGKNKDSINRIRAVFADADGVPLEPIMACGLEPHFIVNTSPGKWHVYWLVDGLPLDQFKGVQLSIAQRFGTDASVCDLPRLMRLPGFNHQKGAPHPVRIIRESGALPYSADTILAEFPPAEVPPASAPRPQSAAPAAGSGIVVDVGRHEDSLQFTGRMARAVVAGGMSEDNAWAVIKAEADRGRWTRAMPELRREFDGALRKIRNGEFPTHQQNVAPANSEAANDPPLALAIADALRPFTAADYERASVPHPHAFMGGDEGLFPVGEATVVAAQGREGKTYASTAILTAYVRGEPVAGLAPQHGRRCAVIYSGEDDPTQYARKVLALGELHGQGAWRDRIIVPDLRQPGIAEWRALVQMIDRRAVKSRAVTALIAAMKPMMQAEYPPGLVLFETASTLTEADEDGTGHRVLIDAVRTVAAELNVAAVLVHHTSQQAAANLPTLNVSVADIRGATQLVFNARQCLLLVSLGSDDDPHPDSDARTMLRKMVAPGWAGRVTVLIPLDTSKAVNPPPVFHRWHATARGPALAELTPPTGIAGKQWRKVLAMLRGQRAEMAAEAKDVAAQSKVAEVVAAAERLRRQGRPASARAVSEEAGHAAGWADRYLLMAVESSLLQRSEAKIPNTKGQTVVYLLPELSDKAA